MLLSAAAAAADLAAGLLACPSCGSGGCAGGGGAGRGDPAGWRATARLRPQRARCCTCRATHILLPAWWVPRRADAIEVIVAATTAALHGAGPTRIGADLDVPAATVRGWLRRLRSRAGQMRQDAMYQLGFLAGLADPPLSAPSSLPLGDALSAVAACAYAAITRFGLPRADLWPLCSRFGLARYLAPAPGS